MKKLVATLTCLLASSAFAGLVSIGGNGRTSVASGGGGATSYTTSFDTTENPLSEGGNWLGGATDALDWKDFQSGSGRAYAGAFSSHPPPPFNDSAAVLKSSAYAAPPDQFAEIQVFKTGFQSGTHELGILLRATITAHSIIAYEGYVNHSANFGICKWKGAINNYGCLTITGPGPDVPVTGDVFRMEVSGSSPVTLRFYQNGVLKATATDSESDRVLSGQPGMQSFCWDVNTPENYGATSFNAGAL